MGAGKTVEKWDSWRAEMKARHGNSNGHGPSLSIEVQRLLPTPTAWLGRRPSHSIGDAERWNNKERSRELSDCIAATMPGETTPPPSPDGSGPVDDAPPPQ
jgi:hypothetical protein